MKLLLHACCAPCSVQCVETLFGEGIRPDLFWYNPNIHPYTEYRFRRDALAVFTKDKKLLLVQDDEYGLRSFIRGIYSAGKDAEHAEHAAQRNDNHPGRCAFCYRLRLEKTARLAAEKKYNAFSSTLLISPYQNHELLRETGESLAVRYGVEFLYRDFRSRFRQGQNEAREAGYYMQKYCGCIFSEEERYLGKKKNQAPGCIKLFGANERG